MESLMIIILLIVQIEKIYYTKYIKFKFIVTDILKLKLY